MLRSMQSDALGRGAERDPFLYQQYNKEIREELNKLSPDYRFSSEGVQQAEALVRGKHYNELRTHENQQWAQQQQWAAWQQQQYVQQIPPQSLPRADLGENQQTNLYNLPAAAREVAYQMGIPLEEYAQQYVQFHGIATPGGGAGQPQPLERSIDSLAGAEGMPFIPEGEEVALANQQRAAAWAATQQQQMATMGMMGAPGMNPYYWQPGVPNPQMPGMQAPAAAYPQYNAPFGTA